MHSATCSSSSQLAIWRAMSGNDDDACGDRRPPQQDFPTTPQNVPRPAATPQTPSRSWYALPPPLKRIFDKFPLVSYHANALPQRAPRKRNQHVLHVFTTEQDARTGRPSFNPACLKWQTFLKFAEVPFTTTVSSNHASPSGALPFLQPAGSDPQSSSSVDPVPSNRLKKWLPSTKSSKKLEETSDVRYEAYTSLLDNRIRKAWLCQLYLSPCNTALVEQLYVKPCSSHTLVQMAIVRQLRSAAEAELIKSTGTNVVSAEDLQQDAEAALEALSVLLGTDEWFFGQASPGMLDASVFAYTHLISDERLPWKHNPLEESLARHQNLVQHRNQILDMYY